MDNSDQKPDASARLEEFQSEVERLHIRGSSPSTEKRLLLVGSLLMPVGIVLVLIGWWGASGTSDQADQVPFLISGGVLGLTVTFAGAALFLRYSLGRYLRYWLLRLIYEERISTDRSVEALDRIAGLLGDTADTPGTTQFPPASDESMPAPHSVSR
jgi:hypothetical protein